MPTGYLRFPSIAGDTVVFACEDDLWSVGAGGGPAVRLTAGLAEAGRPRLSPDGALVAFTGTDDGPAELYVMPSTGGPAQRLTYQAATDCRPAGWDPATGEIVYATTAEQPAGFGHRLFAVHPDGGPPRPLPYGPATAVTYGPGGEVVLCRNATDPARWKRYRGGAAGELWIDDGSGFRPLVTLKGNVAHPCWAGGRVYFVADHESVGNVYSCRPDGTGLVCHTGHRDFYARNLQTDGVRLVHHAGARLHLTDPAAGSRAIEVDLPGTRSRHTPRYVPGAAFLESARISPDGTALAVTSRGKAFTLPHWSGPVRQHGRPDGVRYRLLSWLADQRHLVAVAGDEDPEERLVLLDTGSADGSAAETELPTGGAGHVTELLPAPVGGLVAFATNRQRLYVVDTEAPSVRLLDHSPHDRIEDLAWSPDGRWLAYTFPDTARSSAIKVAELATGSTWQVTRPVLCDMRPSFDPDGRYLYFVGQRAVTPEPDQVDAEVGFPFGTLPYAVTLRAGTPAPFVPRPGPPGADPPAAAGGSGPVVIDLAGIEDRVVPFPVPESRYAGVFGAPGKALLWSVPLTAADPLRPEHDTRGQVTVFDLDRIAVTLTITHVDDLEVRADADVLAYRSGDRLRVVPAACPDSIEDDDESSDAKPGRPTGWVDLDRLRVPLRVGGEWRQMFREAWRLQRENFWSAGMAGVDWPAVYDRYRPLAGLVASRSELSDLIWELHGELGASHAYEKGGDYPGAPKHAQGFLGVDWAAGAPSEWRIGAVLRGDPWNPAATSPCTRPGADVRSGDTVVAVNGQPVGPYGPGELLVGLAGQEVELSLRRGGEPLRRVCVRALADEAPARYRDWVEGNRRYVAGASGGRLGYLHVPDMLRTGYTEFVRGFLGALDCQGLVVDVRFNSGGHISPLLLEKLSRRRLGAEHSRWGGVRPYPLESPAGPMALLMNEGTGSDGEIFSHLFRALGLGPLIGRRTWGGVMAVWPRHPLADGTVTVQPEFRYVFDGVGDLLENYGVEPDVEVVVPPGETQDRQLALAVSQLVPLLAPGGPHGRPGLAR